METATITNAIEYILGIIPIILNTMRSFIIGLNLPISTVIIFGVISIVIAVYWVKNLFKLSTLINIILLSIIIYLVLNYV